MRNLRSGLAIKICLVSAITWLSLPNRSAKAQTISEIFGVNTHVGSGSSHYSDSAGAYNKALWLGATHLRQQAYNPNAFSTVATMLDACSYGLSWTLIMEGDPAFYWPTVVQFAAIPGCLHALEGPNEINVKPPVYGSLSGDAAAIAITKALAAQAGADPRTVNVPIYSLTVSPGGDTSHLGNLSAYVDAAASHPYMSGGYPPECCLLGMAKAPLGFAPGRPLVMTETGYPTIPNTNNAVDAVTQARLLMYTFLDGLWYGMKDIIVYQLLDADPDPTNTNWELHFGFFKGSTNPESIKMSGYAFHYLMQLVGASTPRGPIGASLLNAPPSERSLISQAPDGTIFVITWPEPVLWNDVTHAKNAIATTAATLNLGGTYASVDVYDVLTGATLPIASYANVASIPLALSTDPLIVALRH